MEIEPDDDDANIVDLYFPDLQELRDSQEKPARSSRTKSAQFQKLFAFMETHSDFTKGKTSKKQAAEWDVLTTVLNGMGPPVYSSKRWRKVWSDYKGNKKRKMNQSETATQLKTFIHSTLLSETGKKSNSLHTITGKNVENKGVKTEVKDDKKALTDVLTNLREAIKLQTKANQHLKKSIEIMKMNFHSV